MTEKKNYCNNNGKCTACILDTDCKYYEPCCCDADCGMCVHWYVYADDEAEDCLNEKARKEAGAE